MDYEDIQRRQIAIADRFLNGQRFKLWGRVPLFRSMRKTAALYQDVVSLGPYSNEAPEAQMKIGLAWLWAGALGLAWLRSLDKFGFAWLGLA